MVYFCQNILRPNSKGIFMSGRIPKFVPGPDCIVKTAHLSQGSVTLFFPTTAEETERVARMLMRESPDFRSQLLETVDSIIAEAS